MKEEVKTRSGELVRLVPSWHRKLDAENGEMKHSTIADSHVDSATAAS
jgi:hypothetical protein